MFNTTTFFSNFTSNDTLEKFLNITSAPPKIKSVFGEFKVTIHDWFLCLAFLIIMCTGILGNLLVVYVFGYSRRRKTKTTELLIIYLAIVDLMTSLFNPPLYIYWTLNKYAAWHFGSLGCKIIPAIGPIMTTASGWILLVFAVERYVAIVLPFYGKFNAKTVTLSCVVSVIVSLLMYVHYINTLTLKGNYCYIPNVKAPDYAYPNCVFIAVRLIAFIAIFIVTNVQIFISLQRNRSTHTIKGIKEHRSQQSRKIIRILAVMGIVFVVLVFPRELFYLVYNMSSIVGKSKGISFSQSILHVNSWLKVMHTANSCANVFIYAHMQRLYRNNIVKFLHFVTCRKYRNEYIDVGSVTETTVASPNINNSTNRIVLKTNVNYSQRGPCVKEKTGFRRIPTKVFFHRAQKWKIVTSDAQYDPIYL